jgi:DNA primase
MKEDTAAVLSIEGREVRVAHPDKPYFSKQTKLSKLDLLRYYLSVAPGALAGIRDRPLVLKRFVDGAEGEAFCQILSLAQGRPESSDHRSDIWHPL